MSEVSGLPSLMNKAILKAPSRSATGFNVFKGAATLGLVQHAARIIRKPVAGRRLRVVDCWASVGRRTWHEI